MQAKAESAGKGRDKAGLVIGPERRLKRFGTQLSPAFEDRPAHAHTADRLALALRAAGKGRSLHAGRDALRLRMACQILVQQGEHHQKQTAGDRQRAHPRVKQKDRRRENRGPGHVEQREQDLGGEHSLHRLQIVQRLAVVLGRACRQSGAENALVECLLESRPDTGHDAPARPVQNSHERIECDSEDRQGEKCLFRAASKDAVVNLQHIDRTGQHQQIDEHAEKAHSHKRRDVAISHRAQLFQALRINRLHWRFFDHGSICLHRAARALHDFLVNKL